MGIAVVTPIDKVLKLIKESPWGQQLNEAAKHLTGHEDGGVILVTDPNTGALLAKLPASAFTPMLSAAQQAAGSPETETK